jgi:hypothetical protein
MFDAEAKRSVKARKSIEIGSKELTVNTEDIEVLSLLILQIGLSSHSSYGRNIVSWILDISSESLSLSERVNLERLLIEYVSIPDLFVGSKALTH